MENGTAKSAKDNEKKRNNPNIFSSIFLCWMCPVLFNGSKRDVQESDLIIPSKTFDSERLGIYLERYWLEELQRASQQSREPSLSKALIRAFWLPFLPGGLLVLLNAIVRTIVPLLFAELLTYWSVDSELTQAQAGYYALGILGLNFAAVLFHHHTTLFVSRFSLKIKVACTSLVYRKLLRISQVSIGDVAAGKIVNILSNDMARFDYGFMFLHHIWMVPLQTAFVLYFMYVAAGYAPFVGLFGVVILIFPIQGTLTKMTAVMRRKTAVRTDKRIKLMTEIINGIQVIKMYAWERPFQKVVSAARAYEMTTLQKSLFIRSTMMSFMLFTEKCIMFITILILTLTGSLVTATVIYPIQQFIGLIQTNLTLILPFAIASISEMKVTVQRIQGCLVIDEREDLAIAPYLISSSSKDENVVGSLQRHKIRPLDTGAIVEKKFVKIDDDKPLKPVAGGGEYAAELSNVSASWTGSKIDSELTLKNISIRIRKGKLCAIIGPVGSGKSSLLQVLLKELPVTHGTCQVRGSMSYSCQESWLFPDTVRENILFGLPYDSNRYNEVCKVCQLLPDFKQFPYGDMSLVGERGVSLSGGQRARINLARAVYRDVDIYLLDDPLSAVDANVGRLLFEGCIKEYLRGRTVVLVTHQIHFLKSAEHIVVLNDGAIENIGSYSELAESGKEFSLLLAQNAEGDDETGGVAVKRPSFHRGLSKMSIKSEEDEEEHQKQIQAEEERSTGRLKMSLLMDYLKAVKSWCIVVMVVLVMILAQASATVADYWLSFWTNQIDEFAQTIPEGEEIDVSLGLEAGILTIGSYLWIYGGLIIAIIILSQVRVMVFVSMAMRASQNLHDLIFKNLIVALMRFFDTNPSGRVLNRFSKDLGAMDELLPRSMIDAIQMYLLMASILVLVAIALPWSLIPTAILMIAFVYFLGWYLKAAQAVKRLEGTTKSPVFGMVNSTISGMSTIRCSESEGRLLKTFDAAQDLHSSAFYTYLGGTSAFGMYLDFLCVVYMAVIMAIFIFIDFGSVIPVGSVGLAVSQAMTLTMMLQMAARSTSEFLAQMTAVERVLEYTKLPQEKDMDVGKTKPPSGWPPNGGVKFENVSLTYGEDDPPVLKNLNFEIKHGWKVGVVGRTGAGKSSLISALFRLYDVTGVMKVDEVDTLSLSKVELRTKISIIPQEPVLFSATLRYNLDPFDMYSDEDIWRALEQVELKESVPALDFKVSEGGSNFSVGQRQLICLARAILRSNKVLVMDEATANVDPQTDSLIQETIRREFAACTVITIAHRLNTVMDSDRILVMDKGEIAEFDYPYNLLLNPNSILRFMVNETGESMSKNLLEVAKTKYFNDNPDEKLER